MLHTTSGIGLYQNEQALRQNHRYYRVHPPDLKDVSTKSSIGRRLRKSQGGQCGTVGKKTGGVCSRAMTSFIYLILEHWQNNNSVRFPKLSSLQFDLVHYLRTDELQPIPQQPQQWHFKNSPTTPPYVCSMQQPKANTVFLV